MSRDTVRDFATCAHARALARTTRASSAANSFVDATR